LIGFVRRECLDRIVVFGEAHLVRDLAAYAGYYNELRTHLSLSKDSPSHRLVQRLGWLSTQPIFGGLHHQTARFSSRQMGYWGSPDRRAGRRGGCASG
jgi:hypothetical protein